MYTASMLFQLPLVEPSSKVAVAEAATAELAASVAFPTTLFPEASLPAIMTVTADPELAPEIAVRISLRLSADERVGLAKVALGSIPWLMNVPVPEATLTLTFTGLLVEACSVAPEVTSSVKMLNPSV